MVAANLHEGLDSTLMILKHQLKAAPLRPEIQLIKEYGALPLVECYLGQFNQVFLKIIANAIDELNQGYSFKQTQCFSSTITTCFSSLGQGTESMESLRNLLSLSSFIGAIAPYKHLSFMYL